MIALALVGHSEELLRALAAMVAQAAPRVPVVIAGGTPTGSLGTSSPGIVAALRAALRASAGEGVVVLFDLGSAVLALEVALEELADVDRARIAVSDVDRGDPILFISRQSLRRPAASRGAVTPWAGRTGARR